MYVEYDGEMYRIVHRYYDADNCDWYVLDIEGYDVFVVAFHCATI